jgi:spermidine/putrescine transport system ATP-binding protein
VYEKPATRFVADFIGESNFLQGAVDEVSDGRVRMIVEGSPVYAEANGVSLSPGQQVTLTVRPERLILTRPEEADNPGLTGVVRETVYIGTDTRFVVDLVSGGHIVARLQNIGSKGLGEFSVGDPVKVLWACQDARALTH